MFKTSLMYDILMYCMYVYATYCLLWSTGAWCMYWITRICDGYAYIAGVIHSHWLFIIILMLDVNRQSNFWICVSRTLLVPVFINTQIEILTKFIVYCPNSIAGVLPAFLGTIYSLKNDYVYTCVQNCTGITYKYERVACLIS